MKYVYYHGTTVDRVAAILTHGLDPAMMSPEYLDEDEEPMPFVFLAESPRTAAEFGPVVLRVTLPASLEATVRHDLGEFARCPVLIPAWCLHASWGEPACQSTVGRAA